MDGCDFLPVRFHFNGEFLRNSNGVFYVGGTQAMSYIDRDKLSLPEVVGHLRDHCNVKEGTILHWLFPGRDMSTGLRALVDDKVCQIMSDCIVEGDVVDVYAENHEYDAAIEASVYEEEMEENSKDNEIEDEDLQPLTIWKGESKEIDKQVDLVSQFYCTPNNMPGDTNGDEMSNTDGEYMPGDSCSSGDDEEATQIHKKFKDFKKKIKKGEAASLDDVIYEGVDSRPQNEQEDEDDGNNTPYLDSSDAESIDELGGTGQGSLYPRFNKKKPVVKFKLGMKFSSKKQFKKAALKHGLDERKVIRFIKNDPKRVRAICDWEGCPWVCLLSNTSRSDSWQISTFTNNHMCPPRRDNKLVTSAVIARKYEKFIFANPCWKIPHMQQTVQEEMFATVSKSKLKRAKSLVMQKALDATKKQYSRLYDYQMELLRSNPGSNVIVNKEDNVEPPIFRRMYICLHACKEGFKAGCRKVVGLDGCFFKGATNGELLCAIGRDANNQMYPIAWAVVDKENNDNWDWQLSGLPCCHAISCILFKTNCLDEYVADCYSVHHFNQTYSHCLNPVEGMNSWPASDREPLRAPSYVKMPGRPKTERRREPTEVRKATKMSKTGTIIRCSKCRLPGHNKSTCTNISGAGPSHAGGSQRAGGSSQSVPASQPTGYKSVPVSQPTGSQSAAGGNPNAMVVLSNTQKSTASGTKRTATSDVSSAQSMKKAKATNSQNVIKSSARARVSTIPSGSATINLQARVPTSNVNCSVNVQLTGGTASAHVSAQEPAKKKPIPNKYGTNQLQILPPYKSDKL